MNVDLESDAMQYEAGCTECDIRGGRLGMCGKCHRSFCFEHLGNHECKVEEDDDPTENEGAD